MKAIGGIFGAGALAVLLNGISTAALAQASPAPAADEAARIAQLEAEVADLAAEVQDLKRGQAVQVQTLADVESKQPRAPTAVLSIANGKPQIASADGKFTANFHGILQFDAGQYFQDSLGPLSTDLRRSGPALGATAANVDLVHARELKAGTDVRRARIGVDGTAFGDWDYRLIFDFGGSGVENTGQFYEGWVQYSGWKPLHARIGAFPPSIGLEDQGSTNGMPLLERSVVEDIARGLAAGDTRTAASVWGAGDHWFASAAVTGRVIGTLNTGTAAAVPQTFGDQLGFVGRIAGTPLFGADWLVHVGAHGSYVARPANTGGPGALGPLAPNAEVIALSNTQELRVDGTKLINTGNIDARNASSAGLEFAAQKQNLLLQSEYEQFNVTRNDIGLSSPNFHGWYIEGDWVITGERRAYNKQTAAFDAPPVAHPFSWGSGGWGAFELAARYSDMDLNFNAGAPGKAPVADAIRGGEEQNWTIGLNWYPNAFTRLMLDYDNVRIDRLSPCGGPNSFTSASCTTVWQTKVGSQIGQSYQAIALRSQFAF
ncbi:MAG TPA: porin [Caulobacteraceae bacterium]|nr:porin [Caulobacteraceae bacterium]